MSKKTEHYKLVEDDRTTLRGMSWPDGARRRATGDRGQGLCSSEYLHGYHSRKIASFVAPLHGMQDRTLMLRVTGVIKEDDGLKVGCRQQTVIGDAGPLPKLTTEQRAAIAILIAPHPSTRDWAIKWLSGEDGTSAAALRAASRAVEGAAAAAKEAWWTAGAAGWVAQWEERERLVWAARAAMWAAKAASSASLLDIYWAANAAAYAANAARALSTNNFTQRLQSIIEAVIEGGDGPWGHLAERFWDE